MVVKDTICALSSIPAEDILSLRPSEPEYGTVTKNICSENAYELYFGDEYDSILIKSGAAGNILYETPLYNSYGYFFRVKNTDTSNAKLIGANSVQIYDDNGPYGIKVIGGFSSLSQNDELGITTSFNYEGQVKVAYNICFSCDIEILYTDGANTISRGTHTASEAFIPAAGLRSTENYWHSIKCTDENGGYVGWSGLMLSQGHYTSGGGQS